MLRGDSELDSLLAGLKADAGGHTPHDTTTTAVAKQQAAATAATAASVVSDENADAGLWQPHVHLKHAPRRLQQCELSAAVPLVGEHAVRVLLDCVHTHNHTYSKLTPDHLVCSCQPGCHHQCPSRLKAHAARP